MKHHRRMKRAQDSSEDEDVDSTIKIKISDKKGEILFKFKNFNHITLIFDTSF